ncbi:MAG: acylphosphatase [Bacteroidetes bacterium]|nr:acylphosphatase [Bacteroidota bacterium]
MLSELSRVEIIVIGLVQGVGFRYFVFRQAERLGLKGYVKNLYSGEVYIVAEGNRTLLEEFYKIIKIGPMHADVRKASIKWVLTKNEFNRFEIIY